MAGKRSTVTGFREAAQVFDRLPERVQNRVLQRVANAGARVFRAAIQAAAPVSDIQSAASKKYGHLRDNIKQRVMRKMQSKSARGAQVHTGNAFWALFIEIGVRGIPANPFMRKATEDHSDTAVEAMRNMMGKGIEAEAKKLAGSYATAKKSLR